MCRAVEVLDKAIVVVKGQVHIFWACFYYYLGTRPKIYGALTESIRLELPTWAAPGQSVGWLNFPGWNCGL